MTYSLRNLIVDVMLSVGISGIAVVYKLGIIPDGNDVVTFATFVAMIKVFYDIAQDYQERRKDRRNKPKN